MKRTRKGWNYSCCMYSCMCACTECILQYNSNGISTQKHFNQTIHQWCITFVKRVFFCKKLYVKKSPKTKTYRMLEDDFHSTVITATGRFRVLPVAPTDDIRKVKWNTENCFQVEISSGTGDLLGLLCTAKK